MRYPVSGASTAAISPATASSNQSIGVSITPGRVFWLRAVWTVPNATSGPLHIIDATVGSTATTPALVLPLRLPAKTITAVTVVTATDTVTAVTTFPLALDKLIHSFSPPGLKFSTNPVARLAASGSIAAGEIGCLGYEE